MRSISGVLILLCGLLAAAGMPAPALALELGSKAPDFLLQGSDGRTYTLSQFVGRHGLVLAWFPRAFTAGCTQELAELRDSAALLAQYETPVFMVSLDDPEQNRAFAESLGADLVLLSDPDGKVAARYGVTAPGAEYAKRWTFYVDAQGVVREIDRGVKVESAGQDIARKLGELGFPKKAPKP